MKLINGIDDVFEASYCFGAYATYLSGSGPSVVSFIDNDNSCFAGEMNKFFDTNLSGWRCRVLTIDNVGAVVRESHRGNILEV
jgi:homoserine kinase